MPWLRFASSDGSEVFDLRSLPMVIKSYGWLYTKDRSKRPKISLKQQWKAQGEIPGRRLGWRRCARGYKKYRVVKSQTRPRKRLHHVLEDFTVYVCHRRELHGPDEFIVNV